MSLDEYKINQNELKMNEDNMEFEWSLEGLNVKSIWSICKEDDVQNDSLKQVSH